MTILGLDVGSSSIKAGVLRGTKVAGPICREFYPTHYDGVRAELDPALILKAIAAAVAALGKRATKVDAIALSVMCPCWVMMDRLGHPLAKAVTHQDRRGVAEAKALEQRVGRAEHLRLAGNRPFPGGISSTTWNWFRRHEPARIKHADLVGQLPTYLHRHMTGARVIDPSNASFTGLYATTALTGWSDELCAASRMPKRLLPDVLEGDQIAGHITAAAARKFGLTEGTPMLAGLIDGSSAMLLAGSHVGQMTNVSGSTDVLAVLVDRPRPHPELLTRALGIGRRWMSVATLAAAGSALHWIKQQMFNDIDQKAFDALVKNLASKGVAACNGVTFAPYLAGERAAIDQRTGGFANLTLAATREQMLAAVVESLAEASAARLPLLARGVRLSRRVVLSGGAASATNVLHRDWSGPWHFHAEKEASLRGLGTLTPR